MDQRRTGARAATAASARNADGAAVPRAAAARTSVGRVLAVAGVLAYNWWVVAPFVVGGTSADAFYSDMAAEGRPHAAVLQRLDVLAGALLAGALLLRGAAGRNGHRRREWVWLLGFAMAAALGGLSPYACSPDLDASCRHLERNLSLPLHHYIHMVAGVSEFVFATTAVVLAHVASASETTIEARISRVLTVVVSVGLPLLCLAFLTGRWGASLEPVFFVAFNAMVLVEVFTPDGRQVAPSPADRAD